MWVRWEPKNLDSQAKQIAGLGFQHCTESINGRSILEGKKITLLKRLWPEISQGLSDPREGGVVEVMQFVVAPILRRDKKR